MLYALLILIAVGVFLMSEDGKKLLKLLAFLGVIGGVCLLLFIASIAYFGNVKSVLYYLFWVIVILIISHDLYRWFKNRKLRK